MNNPVPDILAAFREKTGIVFPDSRRADTERAVQRAISEAGMVDPEPHNQLSLSNGPLYECLVKHLTVCETYFFRDNAQFEEIRDRVLPKWRATHPLNATLRAWSAGCASGEEPYSLAILFEQEGIAADIIGSDIARHALAKAKRGLYDRWSLRGSGHRAQEYCGQAGTTFSIPARFQTRVQLRHLNLAEDGYPSLASGISDMDIVLCRNVLIYFDEPAIRHVAKRIFSCLAPGGWLITGPSDPPLWDYAPFEPVITPAGVLYQRKPDDVGQKIAARPSRQSDTPPTRRRSTPSRQSVPTKPLRSEPFPKGNPQSDLERLRALADRGDLTVAIDAADLVLANDPALIEAHYIRAITLFAAGRGRDALEALRRVIYLDDTLAIPHFVMATLHEGLGDLAAARRAYVRVDVLCAQHSPDEVLPLSEGETAAQMATIARRNIIRLHTGVTTDD